MKTKHLMLISNKSLIEKLRNLLSRLNIAVTEEYTLLHKLYVIGKVFGDKAVFRELERVCAKYNMHPVTGIAFLLKKYPSSRAMLDCALYLINEKEITTSENESEAKEYVKQLAIKRLNEQFYS